jgi:hypothetical protein
MDGSDATEAWMNINPGIIEKKSAPWGAIIGGIAAAAATIATAGAAAGPSAAALGGATAAGTAAGAGGAAAGAALPAAITAAEVGKGVAIGSSLAKGATAAKLGVDTALGAGAVGAAAEGGGTLGAVGSGIKSAINFGQEVQGGAGVGGTAQKILSPDKVSTQGLPAMERKVGLKATDYGPNSILEQQLAQYRRRIGG